MAKKFYTYAIYSESCDKIYIGYSSDPNKRLAYHNSSLNHGWTCKFKPWKLVHIEEFDTKKDAMLKEKQLKSARGRKFIWEIFNPMQLQ
jgi:putative endonuclease